MVQRKRPAFPARPLPTPRGVDRDKSPLGDILVAGAPDLDAASYVERLIRDVPDFPKQGILFKDITPLLADPRGFHMVLHSMADQFVGQHLDAVVAIESRGFIFGAALAARLNLAFVPVRKPGKLPSATTRVSYHLEYGTAELEMHEDALRTGARVLIVDDVLATGGTAAAAAELVKIAGAVVVAYAFALELAGLSGRARLEGAGAAEVVAVLRFD